MPPSSKEAKDAKETKESKEEGAVSPMQEAKEHLQEIIKNPVSGRGAYAPLPLQVHFPARWLQAGREQTGLPEEQLAAVLGAFLCALMAGGDQAPFVCNSLLVAAPLLLSFVYVEECPPTPQLLVYWACFGGLTVLDSELRNSVPLYFVLKVGGGGAV